MIRHTLHRFGLIALLSAVALLPAQAARLRLTANLDAAQETPASTSTATGTATMWVETNTGTFDLEISVTGMSNAVTGSHVHEAAVGVAGGVVTGLGAESAYARSGNNLTATFTGLTYGGDVATLISGGAYLNLHSAAFPGGEIRGQLWADPINLWANLTPGQEVGTVESAAYGAATMEFNPTTGKFQLVVFVYNFTNTFANSHIHEAPTGVAGGVVNGLGAASAYNVQGTTYSQVWSDVDYAGNMENLLSGGAYVNVHSNVYPGGELRGQLWISQRPAGSSLVNVSTRGMVGTGDAALVTGFVVAGQEPLQILVTARGPILTGYGVTNALADPQLAVYDRWGTQLVWNDNVADNPYAEHINMMSFAPTEATEAAAVLLLPPGTYTSTVWGVDGSTGIALSEAFQTEN